jgi:hypothetical protein
LIRHVRRFAADRSGDVAMMFGLMSMAMFLSIGAAVDFGRWLNARQATMAALDSAVLAGGRSLQISNDWNAAVAMAEQFYRENTKERIELESDEIQFAVVEGGMAFTASGDAYIKTPFLSLMGIERLPVLALTGAEHSKAQIAVGGNAKQSVEIGLMLDVSGSMSGQKVIDMKNAAKDLVDIVVWDDQSKYYSKIALAPFSYDVALPTWLYDAVRDPTMNANVMGPTHTCRVNGKNQTCQKGFSRRTLTGGGCIVERKGSDRYTDQAPGANRWLMPMFGRNQSITTGYTGNVNCSTPISSRVEPLTNNKTLLKSRIDGMQLGGGTAGHLGTAWAWYLISPEWSSILPNGSKPASYTNEEVRKIAILMTDGEYNTEFTIHGVAVSESQRPTPNGAANSDSNTQARALCDAMKAKGITVYTVGFDLGAVPLAIQTLNYCASSPGHAYVADNGEQLRQAFRDIALKISTLYLSR